MLLKEFFVDVDLQTFYDTFWLNSEWYKEFLTNQLKDIEIQISDWDKVPIDINSANDTFPISMKRKVRSLHPAKMSFPGLPSHAEVSFPIDIILISSLHVFAERYYFSMRDFTYKQYLLLLLKYIFVII